MNPAIVYVVDVLGTPPGERVSDHILCRQWGKRGVPGATRSGRASRQRAAAARKGGGEGYSAQIIARWAKPALP